MKTVVVVGAGSGLGYSMARRFGREGYQVALVSRTAARLEQYAKQLAGDGIHAAAFPADVSDRPQFMKALNAIEKQMGSIDILAWAPMPTPVLVQPEQLTVELVHEQMEPIVYGAVTAVQTVLPGMLKRGSGALLFTGGLSGKLPVPSHSSIGLAMAAQRNLVYVLHEAFKDKGIYAGTVTIAGLIARSISHERVKESPELLASVALIDPDHIADLYWDMVQKRDRVEETVGDPQGIEAAFWRNSIPEGWGAGA